MKYLLAACVIALPGVAYAKPVFLPTRDVAVTYEVVAPNRAPENVQLSYNAAGQLARVDAPAGFYVIGNLPAGQAALVVPALHAVVQAPDFSDLTSQVYNAEGATFTPLGPGHYAGLDCENYLARDKDGTAKVCLTPTGVVLHFTGHDAHGSADVTALSVNYAPQPADLFVVPPGLIPLELTPEALTALLNQ